MSKKPIYVHADTANQLTSWAKRNNMDPGEAIDRVVKVAIGRLGALSKYNKRKKQEKKAMEMAAKLRRERRKSARAEVSVQ